MCVTTILRLKEASADAIPIVDILKRATIVAANTTQGKYVRNHKKDLFFKIEYSVSKFFIVDSVGDNITKVKSIQDTKSVKNTK